MPGIGCRGVSAVRQRQPALAEPDKVDENRGQQPVKSDRPLAVMNRDEHHDKADNYIDRDRKATAAAQGDELIQTDQRLQGRVCLKGVARSPVLSCYSGKRLNYRAKC
jgi:hypothetical protein